VRDDVKPGLPHAPRATRPTLPILLTGLFALALLAVAGLIILENYRTALKEGEARALSSAHVVAAHLEWMIEASDQALRRIGTEVGDRPIDGSPGLAADLSRAVGQLPAGFQYSLLDDTGVVRFSSAGGDTPGNVSDNHSERSYFSRLRDGQDLTFTRLLDNETRRQAILHRRAADRARRDFPGHRQHYHPEREPGRFLGLDGARAELHDFDHQG
jgi:hypothetical protein